MDFGYNKEIKKLDEIVKICFLTAADGDYYDILRKSYPDIDENSSIAERFILKICFLFIALT